jgi:hypothetical protein
MPESRFDFRYTLPVVASAQRTRFLRSNQFKVILLIWLGSTIFLIAPLVLPQVFPPGPNTSWALVAQISLIYVVTLLVLIFATPVADFFINRFWRLPLTLQFSEKQVRIFITGKQGGLHLRWGQITQVDEDSRALILHYGPGGKFIILPKSAFEQDSDERRFRDLLSRRSLVNIEEPEAEGEGEPQTGKDKKS